MNRLTRTSLVAAALVAATSLAACSESGGSDADGIESLNIIVPADPGGGWDQTGRALSKVIEDNDVASSASVVNVPGAGGTVGLAQLANERNPDTLMVMGLVMVGAVETNQASTALADTTPIARLTEEQEIIVVPNDSPFETVNDLVDAIKDEGQGVSIAGGSAGGTDHILAGMLLKESGVAAEDIASSLNYVAFSGGGESLSALLGGKVDAGISGVGEYAEQVKAGELRALAVSGAEPSALLPDVPTLTNAGIDLVLTNWRGLVAPGSIDDEQAAALTELVDEATSTQDWEQVLGDNDWADAYLSGDEFATYLDGEVTTVQATLRDIGLIQ